MHIVNGENGVMNMKRAIENGIYNFSREYDADYYAHQIFENYGTIDIDSVGVRGIWNNNDRGDTLTFKNYGLIDIHQTHEQGIYNRSFTYVSEDADFSYETIITNFNNHGTLNIDSTQQEAIYNYAERADEMNFTNTGDINISRSNKEGIHNRSYNNNMEYNTLMSFDSDDGNITITDTELSGIYNYPQNDTLIFRNNGNLNISNTGEQGIYNYTYQQQSTILFENDENGQISIKKQFPVNKKHPI